MRKVSVGTIGIACGSVILLGCAADPVLSTAGSPAGISSGSPIGSNSESVAHSLAPAPTALATATNYSSAGCRSEPLDQSLQGSVAHGAGLVTGTLAPTGLVTTVDGGGLPMTFTEVTITDVAVLVGAAPARTVSAFVMGGQSADNVVTEVGLGLASAWADDHRVLGVLETSYGLPVVTTLPLVGDSMAVPPGSCWGIDGSGVLATTQETVSYRVFSAFSDESGQRARDMGLTVSQHRESLVVVPVDDVRKLFESPVPSAAPST